MPVSSKQHTAQPKWHAQPPDSHGFECHGILLRKSPSWSPHFQSLFQTMASLILLKLCFLLVSLTQKPLMHSQFLENKVKITSLVFCVLHGLNFLQPLSSFHLTVFLLEHSSLIDPTILLGAISQKLSIFDFCNKTPTSIVGGTYFFGQRWEGAKEGK